MVLDLSSIQKIQPYQILLPEINNYFVNVGHNTEKSIPINPVTKPNKYLKNRNHIKILIAHISNEEVLNIINKST